MLTIKPISGKLNIKQETSQSKIDPYLIIKYGPNWAITGVSKNTDKYPYWTDTFSFIHSGDNLIFIECWNYNIDNIEDGKELLGEGKAELKIQDQANKSLYWATITVGDKNTGEILVEVEFVPDQKKSSSKSTANTPIKSEKIENSAKKKSRHYGANLESDKKIMPIEEQRIFPSEIMIPNSASPFISSNSSSNIMSNAGELGQFIPPSQIRNLPGNIPQFNPHVGQIQTHTYPPPFMNNSAPMLPPPHMGFQTQQNSHFQSQIPGMPFPQQFHPGRPGPGSQMFLSGPNSRLIHLI